MAAEDREHPALVIRCRQAKPQIALELLDRARAWRLRFSCVTADADYGDDPNFLDGLEQRRQRYVVAVRADFAVATSRTAVAQRADALIEAQPLRSWRTITWRESSTSPDCQGPVLHRHAVTDPINRNFTPMMNGIAEGCLLRKARQR